MSKNINNKLIPFSELTKTQIAIMIDHAITACVEYAEKIGIDGLSRGSYNIYTAIEDAIENEWIKAKKQMTMRINTIIGS